MSDDEPFIQNSARLFEGAELRLFDKGDMVLHANHEIENICRVLHGYLKVYTINNRGEELVHLLIGPDEIFPLTTLLGDSVTTLFYQALSSCEILYMPIESARNRLRTNSAIAYATLQQAIEQYKVYATRVFTLEYHYARERLAHRLLLLARRFGQKTEEGIELKTPLTQQVLASSINLSRETVSREVEKFVAKGYLKEISRSGGPIVILDPVGLGKELPGGPQYFTNPYSF